MKVLHAAETIKGGVATVMRQLVAGQINDESIDVRCIVPSEQVSELGVGKENIIVFSRSGRDIYSFFIFFLTFTKTIISFKPDLVHLHSTFSGFMGRVALYLLWPFYRPKVIYCPHAFSFMMKGGAKKLKLYAALERALSPITDVIICVSQYEKSCAIEYGLSERKLKVVHNGVPDKLPSGPTANPFEPDVINAIFVGRFDYQKGFDILLDAMTRVKGEAIFLTAIGSAVHGKDNPREMMQTSYTGWLSSDELAPYLINADVLVMPSRWEGFAMVALEAMSYGLPVLASNCSSFPEMIEDGHTGILFEAENSKDLANYLRNTSKEQWAKMGESARKVFLKNYTSVKMCRDTLSIYNSLAAETQR
jgi:glycosyltransferase involved in cell wall biosynthesis